MASILNHSSSAILNVLILNFLFVCLATVECREFVIGGKNGWATPPEKYQKFYNDWASRHRFQPNDTLRFEYKKDSVMVVTENEYERCQSSHPMFFANNGDTAFTLDMPGLFYFVSGIAGHCRRGLKMVIKVLDTQSESPQASGNYQSSSTGSGRTGFAPLVISLSWLLFSFM